MSYEFVVCDQDCDGWQRKDLLFDETVLSAMSGEMGKSDGMSLKGAGDGVRWVPGRRWGMVTTTLRGEDSVRLGDRLNPRSPGAGGKLLPQWTWGSKVPPSTPVSLAGSGNPSPLRCLSGLPEDVGKGEKQKFYLT